MTAIQLGMPKVVHYGEGNIFEETPFPKYAKEELKNEQLRANLRFVTHAIRNKRARVTAEVPDWQDLRNTGESVKNYVLANLPELLEQFERNFTAAGGHVHWARNATEANQIALDLIREQGVDEIIKIKSMATAETGLNEFLEKMASTLLRPTSRKKSSSSATTAPPTFWCPQFTATAAKSATSSCAKLRVLTRTSPMSRQNWQRHRVTVCVTSS